MTSTAESLEVLVVDDDNHLRRTLADVLRLHGYDPLPAHDGHEALAVAREKQPALALVDLRLPDMDGMELVHRLRDLSRLTQVVILTGNATLDSAVAALREQSCDYLVKPVSPAELLRTVATAGERWQRRNAEDRLAEAHEAVRASEQRYRTIVETTREGVCIIQPEGLITYANERLARMLGREVHAVEGQSLFTFLAPEERGVAQGLLRRGEKGLGDEHEFRLVRADGQGMSAWISMSPLIEPSGRVVASLAMVSDTTERRQLEERVRRVQKLDAIGRLAGGVAHDFNNILSVIVAESDLALGKRADENALQASIGEIRSAAMRATELVRQLLTFARGGATPTQPQPDLDLNRLVTGMESMLHRLIPSTIAFTCKLHPELWNVRANRGQIEQVLTNLVVNARDAMPAGGEIVLRTRNETLDPVDVRAMPGLAPGDYAVLSVTDTGMGMTDEVKARLFEPFFSTKGPDKGTGLGMATSYGIVKQSGGLIAVDSEPGKGAAIHVYLPALPPAAPAGNGDLA